jgi:hypothetical protein
VALLFTQCSKHDDDELSGTGEMVVSFDNRAGNEAFAFGKDFKNAAGETLRFSLLNYYVSNFVLVKSDGSEYVVPKDSCYFLCKHEDAKAAKSPFPIFRPGTILQCALSSGWTA